MIRRFRKNMSDKQLLNSYMMGVENELKRKGQSIEEFELKLISKIGGERIMVEILNTVDCFTIGCKFITTESSLEPVYTEGERL